ncbi:hypothetical protein [Thalassobacillus sp. CUG 92003]|uniref:hypothetical protein n=1 Tax=Thalassobacillus sp. CUG 92003 TaxID=2736641 RepID=UPI0015E6EBC8|nr:hypothetical protein [Thalassobacillus sp. CUG 92003]
MSAFEIIYSIKTALETEIGEIATAQIIYDGVDLTKLDKPFATVEDLAINSELLSAGRTSYEDGYRFQVGVYANGYTERLKLQEKFATVLRAADGIPYFDADLLPTGKHLLCDVSEFTPISNDEIANETNNHHGYFDVAVFILRNNGESEFTQ